MQEHRPTGCLDQFEDRRKRAVFRHNQIVIECVDRGSQNAGFAGDKGGSQAVFVRLLSIEDAIHHNVQGSARTAQPGASVHGNVPWTNLDGTGLALDLLLQPAELYSIGTGGH